MLLSPEKGNGKKRGRPPGSSATKTDGNKVANTEPMETSEATSVAKGDMSEKVMVRSLYLKF